MPWIAWKKVCSPTKCGGLGIGSLQASNLSMLSKWWWRFHTEPNSRWCRLVKSIHGKSGGLDLFSYHGGKTSSRNKIFGLKSQPSKLNIDIDSKFIRKVGTVCQ